MCEGVDMYAKACACVKVWTCSMDMYTKACACVKVWTCMQRLVHVLHSKKKSVLIMALHIHYCTHTAL